MGIFQQFPYTNFHEMNLDWLLNTWKEFSATFEVWKNEVDTTVNEFKKYIESAPIDQYTEEVLTKWLEDGTLEALIRSFVIPQREAIIARELRVLSPASAPLGDQGATSDGSYIYSSGEYDASQQVITKYDLDGTVISSTLFNDLGHANSIAVSDDTIYIADGSAAKVVKINKTSMVITDVITDARFDNIWGVSVNDNKVYVLGSDINAPASVMLFAELKNNGTLDIIHSIANPANTIRQNLCVFGNVIYTLFGGSNAVYAYDLTTGEMIDGVVLPDGDGYYPGGEYESLFVLNNIMYLYGASYSRYDYSHNTYSVMQLFKTNIIAATIVESSNSFSYTASEARLILTVDDTATPGKNPFDTFTTIEEACLIANYHRTADIRAVHLDDGVIHLINGYYNVVLAAGNRNIARVWIENSTAQLYQGNFNNISINRTNLTINNGALTGDISATYSKVHLNKVGMATLDSIASVRTTWDFNAIINVNSALSVTSNNASCVHIVSAAVNNILLLLKISGSGAATIGYGSNAVVFMITATMVSNQAINITVDGNSVTYASGVWGGAISPSTIIEMTQPQAA